jgi:integrase
MTFLKANGIRGLVGKNDWPSYTEEEPEMYEPEELEKLFNACNEQERLWFEFFLMTGMREQEVMHLFWSDINFAASTVRVSHKPDPGWTPKAYKEREIPVPTKLLKKLKAWKAKPKIAKVAMARRLGIRLYWMWRRGWNYAQVESFGSHVGQLGNRHGVK